MPQLVPNCIYPKCAPSVPQVTLCPECAPSVPQVCLVYKNCASGHFFAPTVPQVCPKCAPSVPQLCPNCFCPKCAPSVPQVCPKCAPSNFLPQLCPRKYNFVPQVCPKCAPSVPQVCPARLPKCQQKVFYTLCHQLTDRLFLVRYSGYDPMLCKEPNLNL